jgi:DNA-directed RNA polymerase specialized sigma subunit
LVLLNCPHVLRHTKIVLALQELTERERLVAILDLYEGLGLREIAFVLEMLPSAVIELQADAIQHLNTALSRT